MAKASSDYPFLKHDLAATRRKVLMQFAAAHGDSEDQVDQFSKEYEHQRTALAHDCMYTDTIPFLSELKQNGVLIAAITDGTADVMKTKLCVAGGAYAGLGWAGLGWAGLGCATSSTPLHSALPRGRAQCWVLGVGLEGGPMALPWRVQ